VHCYINQPIGDSVRLARELTLHEWAHLFDQMADEGCLWLLLTGGEVFIRPDALDLYTVAKRKGFIITLFTNGTMITPRIADHLAEWRPYSIEITIYGAKPETHGRVTRVPDAFDRTLRGIENLLERGLRPRLKSVVMTLNRHELAGMRALAERYGLEFRVDPLLNCRLDGSRHAVPLRLSPEEVVQVDLEDPERMAEWRKFCDQFVGVTVDSRYLYACSAGQHSFHVDPYGQLSACLIARHPAYDMRLGTFEEGWHDFLARVREQPAPPGYPCVQCDLLSLCGQCPGWSQLEHGPYDSARPVRYLHDVAALRSQAFGLPGLGTE
jgi:radical SAM protein with 4Fe4S-binding SPASM domain